MKTPNLGVYETGSRPIRPIALARKKRALRGLHGDAETGAVIASLFKRCKLADIDPQAYLVDVLTKIAHGHLNSRIDDPCPGPTNPAAPQAT